ncbi:hypothetical protein [Streptomyces sp. NPDC046939]|uniref:hypothetical protein n=1 Tax=Streptomyces sp. NPDC046939 TaxID=3155376 RepID=UPI0033DB78AE
MSDQRERTQHAPAPRADTVQDQVVKKGAAAVASAVLSGLTRAVIDHFLTDQS